MSSDDTSPGPINTIKDPNQSQHKLNREIARIHGDEYDGIEYDGIRKADADAIDTYHLTIADKSASNQRNHLQHLRNISKELDNPILDHSATELNRTLRRMERDRGWSTDPPGSRKNYAVSLGAMLRANDRYETADDIITPTITNEDYEIEPDCVPNWHDDIAPMINQEPNLRNKAIIATTWESASRLAIISSLQIKHYNLEGDNAAFLQNPTLDEGSKDADGHIKPLVISRAFIDNWLANGHPCPNDEDAALFCSIRERDPDGDDISPKNIREEIIYPAADRANVDEKKKTHPHMLKHSRVTHMKKHPAYDKRKIEIIADWNENSEQHSLYGHTTNEEDARMILNGLGIETEDDENPDVEIGCPRCNNTIAAGLEHCPNCTLKLTENPPEWYEYYCKLVTEDNPIREKYDDISTATRPLYNLPKDQFEYITDIFAKSIALYDSQWTDPDDYPGTHPRNRDWADKIDISDLDADDIDTISEQWVTNTDPLAKNYQKHPTDYELTGSDSGLTPEELREEVDQRGLNDDEDEDNSEK